MVQNILIVVHAAVLVYVLLIVLRIMMTWFGGVPHGRGPELLAKATDPYLRIFRRFRFLRFGAMDFSPIGGIVVLWIVYRIIGRIALTGSVTLGYVLAVIVDEPFRVILFFIGIFMLLSLIRLVGDVIGVNTAGQFWITLDRILEPPAYKIVAKINATASYRHALMLFFGLTALTLIIGNVLVAGVVGFLASLPV